jgi:hypothetical protein
MIKKLWNMLPWAKEPHIAQMQVQVCPYCHGSFSSLNEQDLYVCARDQDNPEERTYKPIYSIKCPGCGKQVEFNKNGNIIYGKIDLDHSHILLTGITDSQRVEDHFSMVDIAYASALSDHTIIVSVEFPADLNDKEYVEWLLDLIVDELKSIGENKFQTELVLIP